MRSSRAKLVLAAVAVASTAPLALAAYPTAPQILDKAATKNWNLMLSDWAIAPKSQPTQFQSSQTNNQAARINFVRAEPVPALASGRLFVPDLNANLLIMDRATKTFTPYINFPSTFNGTGGTGTFDSSPGFAAGVVTLQFDPDYANNGKFYTVHTELTTANPDNFRKAVIYEWSDTNINNSTFEGTRAKLFEVQYTGNIHPIGDIQFNPLATNSSHPDWRNMYIASGDGSAGESSTTSTRNQVQRLDNFLGKILRITPAASGTPGTYSIPAGNPFASDTSYPNAKDEIWAYGLRNPHRLSWDVNPNNTSDNVLFVNNIGLHEYEEVNIVHPGANYGYSKIEGTQVLNGNTASASFNHVINDPLPGTLPVWTNSSAQNPPPAVQTIAPTYPVAQYSHEDGDAISSGFVYRGTLIPQLQGKYVFGDITTGRLFYCDLGDLKGVNDAQPTPLQGDPNNEANNKVHELTVWYSSPFDSQGLRERRVFDIARDAFDRRNEASQPLGSTTFGPADGDGLPGAAEVTDGNDPYGVPYGSGRSDIRWTLIDNELYLITKSDGVIRALSTALGGDADLTRTVDVNDLGLLASHWQGPGAWKDGDFDHNGSIDVNDLGILASNWQVSAPGAPSLQEALANFGLPNVTVPEPGAVGVLMLGSLGLAARRCRVSRALADEPQRA
jgi:glucose/arabinose dehydrogenase